MQLLSIQSTVMLLLAGEYLALFEGNFLIEFSGADGILKIWTLPAVGREMKGKTLEVIDCSQLKGPPRKGDGRDITTIAWSVSGKFSRITN